MAIPGPSQTGVALSAVLSLAPLEYDVQYMNMIVRTLNFMIQQLSNPGLVQGTQMILQDRDRSTKLDINTQLVNDVLTIICTNLPTSSTGLAKGQLWNNAGVLSIVT